VFLANAVHVKEHFSVQQAAAHVAGYEHVPEGHVNVGHVKPRQCCSHVVNEQTYTPHKKSHGTYPAPDSPTTSAGYKVCIFPLLSSASCPFLVLAHI